MKNRASECAIIFIFIIALIIPGLATGSEYRLGVGDVLQISVWGHGELDTSVEVRPDGYITFPLVGDYYAVDKTPTELSREIQAILAEFVVEPRVTVMVQQFRTVKVQLMGEIHTPGYYELAPGARLMDVLGRAGGPTRAADLTQVGITRYEPTVDSDSANLLHVNLQEFVNKGDLAQNPLLQSGDVIHIAASGNVLILGEVRQPAGYNVTDEMDILDLLALAGGATDTADLEQVTLIRSDEEGQAVETNIDVQRLLSGQAQDVPLIYPNDVVFVSAREQIIILGAVQSPGTYPLRKGSRLVDMVGTAGGVLPSANTSQISITRSHEEEQMIMEIDAALPLVGKSGGDNPPLRGGDIIFIPEGLNNVLVLGQVQRPGSYSVTDNMRTLDAIALAGGITERAASDRVTLTRDQGNEVKLLSIDLDNIQQGRTRDQLVEAGDIIFIPEGAPQILVLGQVQNPGSYRVQSDMRLLDVLAQAGGSTDRAGAEMLLSRDGQTTSIDLGSLSRLGLGNQHVEAGDVIYIPEGRQQVLVLGEVRNPGYYQFSYGDRISDAVGYAGGLLDSANSEDATVTRQTDEGTEIVPLNLNELMENRFLANNLSLESGDIIIVPEQNRSVIVFGEVAQPGYYLTTGQTRVLDVIAQAGGLTDYADAQSVTLTKEVDGITQTQQINITQAMKTGEGNIYLSGGEMLHISRSNRTILVFGEVVNPGTYVVEDGDRIMDIIAKAGGPSAIADLSQVSHTRIETEDKELSVIDITQAMIDNNHPSNQFVSGGDMLHIPAGNHRVLVLGQVTNPGAFTVDSYTRLLDALAMAGGPSDLADLSNATLTRTVDGHEEVQTIDLAQVYTNQAENIVLQGGDVLYLPVGRQVIVMGEVSRPGSYTLPPGGRILDILALAGGMESNFQEQALVMTRQEAENERVWHMSYQELMSKQAEHNLLMNGGDVLYVPEARRQVLVLGEVLSPGVYSIPTGARVLDAIALAGGPSDRAALETVGIYRDGSVDATDTLTMGKDKLLFEGDANENPPILGGDVIYVPETNKPNWTNIFSFVGGLRTFQQLIYGVFNINN